MASADYMREWRKQNRGKADPLLHGSPSTYSNGCRCDDCRDAHRRGAIAHRRAKQRLADAHREEYLRYLHEEQRRVALTDGGIADA